MQRYRIVLSYSGADFCGWQIQPSSPSVQECVEKALSTILRKEISLTGAGRTDTAVNATRYTAHFDCPEPVETGKVIYRLNAILPSGIAVLGLFPAEPDFHSRFDASRREYTYFLHKNKDPFLDGRSYFFPHALDVEAMNAAAVRLEGTHDFSCFEKTGGDNKTSVCTVYEASWRAYTPEVCARGVMREELPDGGYLYFRIAADRFLRNMVRAIVGTLLDVGRGKRSVEEFAALLDPPRSGGGAGRCLAGESVPGHALFLSDVNYAK